MNDTLHDHHSYARAASAAALGLGLQLILAIGHLVIWATLGTRDAVLAAGLHAAGGIGVWLTLWLVFKQHRLERLEALEAEQLAAGEAADSHMFEMAADDLAVMRRRLRWMHKWLVPMSGAISAAYLLGMGIYLWQLFGGQNRPDPLDEAGMGLLVTMLVTGAFISFLYSRYVAGMGRNPAWQLLRGGAGYLMGSVLADLGIAASVMLLQAEITTPAMVIGWAIPVMMMVIGLEIGLNLLMNMYRPRVAGQMPRAAFDSRLLSLLTSPESIATSISEAINYQFGFEITRSWFWQLLSHQIGKLAAVGLALLLTASCFVVVEDNEQAVVLRMGRLGEGAPLGPGLHMKLPWPLETAQRVNVLGLRSLTIGAEAHEGEDILWEEEHKEGGGEDLFIAAPPPQDRAAPGAAARQPQLDVSLVNAEVHVQYRVADPRAYLSAGVDSDAMLKAIADRQVARFLMRHDIDDLIGPARSGAAIGDVAVQIQKQADEAGLGLRVMNVAFSSIHPPQKVAEKFHQSVIAEQERFARVDSARQEAIKRMADSAGSPAAAEELDKLILSLQTLEDQTGRLEERRALEKTIETKLAAAGGLTAQMLAQAKAQRWQRENAERGNAEQFTNALLAYRAAPALYQTRAFLLAMSEALRDRRKVLLVGEGRTVTIRGDLKRNTTDFIVPSPMGTEQDNGK